MVMGQLTSYPCLAKRAAQVGNLSSRGLSGEIANALANLTVIESLDLSYNNMTGDVPEFLAQLDNLKILNLIGNNFTKPLPAQLLAKQKKGTLLLSIEESSDEDNSSCQEGSCGNNKHKKAHFLVATIAIALAVVNEIGKGGFGTVFRGSVGDKQVAVKMLSELSSQGYKEFQAEVKLLMLIHHRNITSLVGYCNDGEKKAIVYEFMANGSLEKHIYDGHPQVLSWERRLQIGCDAAEGKAFPAKDATHVSTRPAGTPGYQDLEHYPNFKSREKSDVYSFGVVLLELITGRKAILNYENIVDWVKSSIENRNIETIIDSRLEGGFDINIVMKVAETAMACVSPSSIERPTMETVVMDLKHCLRAERDRKSKLVSCNMDCVSGPTPR
ncbi:hypothetical protein M8C21_031628 [Ambrosia artemisiifolia]|uniref:Protein kinase domain-containing protein n=1 Tax=Ambrosia artemisiifolia TaxID=4212 RepID=A0AAD5G3T8_AMBAR|nr:hypothetical protein M8C21_031628 [Ambrosia artemisiifolia]